MKNVIKINGLEDIYKNYDTFILDQWGVMHNGQKGYSNAINCVEKLFHEKKNLIIISNSSKRKISTSNRLSSLGFDFNHFKEIMTSGEMIWQSLFNKNYEETKNLGKKFFHIYDQFKDGGEHFLKNLEKFLLVSEIKEADFILGCTPFANSKVIDYIPLLEKALQNNTLFLCANPDFETIEVSEEGDKIFCMGTIAELYKSMGGKVFLLGKPKVDIYSESTKNIKDFDKSRTLAIGDSIHHDIKGALDFKIDSLLITSTGIHHELFDNKNPNWDSNRSPLLNMDIKPTFVCSEFTF